MMFFFAVKHEHCMLPLGLEGGWIEDSQIFATSELDEAHSARFARLHGLSSWIPSPNDSAPALTVTFPERMLITGVVLQSGDYDDPIMQSVTNFTVDSDVREEYSNDPRVTYCDQEGEPKVLPGILYEDCPQPVFFDPPLWTYSLKIKPSTAPPDKLLAMRLEILGCVDNDCSKGFGSLKGFGRTESDSASSVSELYPLESGWQPAMQAFEYYAVKGWIPAETSDAWFEITVIDPFLMNGILLRKCVDPEAWLTEFKIWVSETRDLEEAHNLSQSFYPEYDGTNIALVNFPEPFHLTHRGRFYPINYANLPCVCIEMIGCNDTNCGGRLGMQSGDILRSQLSCKGCNETTLDRARLHYYDNLGFSGCSVPTFEVQTGVWFGISFTKVHIITGLMTQGGTLGGGKAGFIERFTVRYKLVTTDDIWRDYMDIQGKVKQFVSATDAYTVTQHTFEQTFFTAHVRLLPDEMLDPGALRLEVMGCRLHDPKMVCGSSELLHNGFCYGVVDEEDDDACNEIFLPNSHPVYIKSADIQNFIQSRRERLLSGNANQFVIGLKSYHETAASHNATWLDDTPLDYSNFGDRLVEFHASAPEGTEVCAYLDAYDCFGWKPYICSADNRATICQYDINECLGETHGCQTDMCVNTPGSYHCTCPDGFRWSDNQCIDVCDIGNGTALPERGDRGVCLQAVVEPAALGDMSEACQGEGRHPVTMEDISQDRDIEEYLHEHSTEFTTWPLLWINASLDHGANSCRVANLTLQNQIDFPLVPCDSKLSYVCKSDYVFVKLLDLWTDSQSPKLELVYREPYGYVEFFGVAPWYGTDVAIPTAITLEAVAENEGIRMLFHYIYLRKSSDVSAASPCIDTLTVLLNPASQEKIICGELKDLMLISPRTSVTLRFMVGRLESSLISTLSFNMTFQRIDCTREECLVGCGSTKIVSNDDGILQTSPFPSTFRPFSICNYDIIAPEGLFLKLNFTEYEMTSVMGPCEDRVDLCSHIDPQKVYASFGCRDEPPPLQITNLTAISVKVATGLESASRGFRATVSYSDKPGCSIMGASDTCPHDPTTCETPTGIIASPAYPQLLEQTLSECCWRIITEPNSYIMIRFIDFEVEYAGSHPSSDGCMDTKLKIQEENEDGDMGEVGEFCPPTVPVPEDYHTKKNDVTLLLSLRVSKARLYLEYETVWFDRVWGEPITGFTCPAGWEVFQGHCYQIFSNSSHITWQQAEDTCQAQCAECHLVSIKQEEEMKFIHSMITSDWAVEDDNRVYIGLKRDDSERGIFRWSDDSPMSYTEWSHPRPEDEGESSQPNGGSLEGCTMIILESVASISDWHDVACAQSSGKRFICKTPSVHNETGERYGTDISSCVYNEPSEGIPCGGLLFQCLSGECIQNIFQCDETPHCSDESDEENCETDFQKGACPLNAFQCSTGDECVSISFRCDHKTQCSDNSDEFGCVYSACLDGEFMCGTGEAKCLPAHKKCDLINDCLDGSDETDCEDHPDVFECYNGQLLPSYAHCDGFIDCIGSHWEDEKHCESALCDPETQLECKNGKCVDLSSVCMYNTDKLGFMTGCRDVTHLRNCVQFSCPPYTYKCPASYCVPLRLRCDGISDCPNGEDEVGCEDGVFSCPMSSYRCQSSNRAGTRASVCLAPSQVCDGQTNCADGDDELFCEFTCPENCTCIGLSVSCELAVWNILSVPEIHPDTRILSLSNMAVTMDTHSCSSDVSDVSSVGVGYLVSFFNLPYLAELNLISTGIPQLCPDTFLNNSNLYKLNLTGNQMKIIEKGALDPLKNLQELDIRENELAADETHKYLFSGVNGTLKELYTDNFVFCCLLPLATTNCDAPEDRFSSCTDLLESGILRVLMWLLGISALCGNVFVVSYRIIQRKQVENSQVQSNLISNLAVSDLLMGVYMLIIAGTDLQHKGQYYLVSEAWRASPLCTIAGFLSMLSSEVSVFLVLLISLDRAFCIVFPFRQGLHLKPKSSLVVITASWVLALVLSLVPVMVPAYSGQFYGRSSVCLALPLTSEKPVGWEYSVAIFLGINFFSFVVTLGCYVAIFVEVRRSSARMAGRRLQQTSQSRRVNAQVKLATKMALIVGTDFVCWMPIIIMGILGTSGVANIPGVWYAWAAVIIIPVNSALNPYLYTLSSLQQRRQRRHRAKSLVATTMSMDEVTTKVELCSANALDNSSLDGDECPSPELNPRHQALLTHCILTPFTHPAMGAAPLLSFTEYIDGRGSMPSVVDSALIRRDIARAMKFLKSKGATDLDPAEEKIAVQLSSGGEIYRAFFVVYNPRDVQRLLQPSSKTSHLNNRLAKQREFVRTMLDDIRGTEEDLLPTKEKEKERRDDNQKVSFVVNGNEKGKDGDRKASLGNEAGKEKNVLWETSHVVNGNQVEEKKGQPRKATAKDAGKENDENWQTALITKEDDTQKNAFDNPLRVSDDDNAKIDA